MLIEKFRCIAVLPLLMFAAPLLAAPQMNEAALRSEAQAEMLRKFNADLQRAGNGSYEAWVAKLAPLREYWTSRILYRDKPKMWFDNFASPDGNWVTHGFRSVLGDITVRLDASQPVYQVIRLHQQLKEQGIDLIFGIVPTSMEIFPEKFVDRPELVPTDGIVAPYRRKFLHLVAAAGVEVVDLVDVLRAAKGRPDADQLTLRNDYHWSNLGVVLSAQAVAERLKRYDFVRKAASNAKAYKVKEVTLQGLGQPLKMWPVTMPGDQPFEPAEQSPILCIGDSNMQIYGSNNPVKNWIPGSPDHADFAAQISRFTGVRASQLSFQAFTPHLLNREPVGTWKGRTVVIWLADGCHVLATAPWSDVRLKNPNKPDPANPKLLSPAPDTLLGKDSITAVTFTWNAVPGASDYWFDIGLAPRSGDIVGTYTGGATSKTVELGPFLGKPIYVELLSKFDDSLVHPGALFEFKTQQVKR